MLATVSGERFTPRGCPELGSAGPVWPLESPPPRGDLQAKSDTGESCGGEVGFMGGAALEKATVDGVDGVFQLRDA